jgi:hypothetical protein
MQAWTVIGEQIIRLTFERAQQERLAFCNRNQDVSASAENLIGCALGYYPSDAHFDIIYTQSEYEISNQSHDEIITQPRDILTLLLEHYDYETIDREARDKRFAWSGYGSKGGGLSTPSQSPHFAAMPGQIVEVLSHDIAVFTDQYPGCRFDYLALAEWTAKILIHLRIAHSAALSVDRKRSAAGKSMRAARTDDDLQRISNQFSFQPLIALKALRPPRVKGGKPQSITVGLDQLIYIQEAVILAMLADIDPRVLNVNILSNPEVVGVSRQVIDAILDSARWLGGLYRGRHGVMSLPQAQLLCWLACPHDLEYSDASAMKDAIATMLSFLTPIGRTRLWEGAALVADDGLARSVFVTTPRPVAPVAPPHARTPSFADLARELGGTTSSPLPDPIILPGGYLLVPGNFAEVWQGQSRLLMAGLKEPSER